MGVTRVVNRSRGVGRPGASNSPSVSISSIQYRSLWPPTAATCARAAASFCSASSRVRAAPNEFTQQLDGKDLARLIEKADKPGDLDSDSDIEVPVVRTNALPDAYPDAVPAKK